MSALFSIKFEPSQSLIVVQLSECTLFEHEKVMLNRKY